MLTVLPADGGEGYDVWPTSRYGTVRLDRNELFEATSITVAEESHTEPLRWDTVDLATGVAAASSSGRSRRTTLRSTSPSGARSPRPTGRRSR